MNNENIGFLEVAVKTADGALPVPDASVNIYEYLPNGEDSGRGTLLFSLSTDENGNTPRVALKTKSKSLSMSPEGKDPFSTYSVRVGKEGFYDATYINTPVFEGITSIQPSFLIPVLEYSREDDDFPISDRRSTVTPNTDL